MNEEFIWKCMKLICLCILGATGHWILAIFMLLFLDD